MTSTAALHRFGRLLALVVWLASSAHAFAQTDPLPSWNDGPAKKAIVEFVQATTTQGSPRFVPPPERVATFNRDGTLWVGQPMYSLLRFIRRGDDGHARGNATLVERRPGEIGDHRFRRARGEGRREGLRAAGRTDRHFRQRRHAVERAADAGAGLLPRR